MDEKRELDSPVEEPAQVQEEGGKPKKKLHIPRGPLLQVLFVSFICFCCPGMFNALSGLGGGGQINATVQDNATVALYSVFAAVAFFAGSICNKLGPRLTLQLGASTYALYIASFLSYSINGNGGFVIAAGAILGIGAGLLWTAQGSLMLSYATEEVKGRYIAFFWAIFNLGGVLGSAIPLGQNAHHTDNTPVGKGTYIGFLVITSLGSLLPWLMVPPESVTRVDGTRVSVHRNPSWTAEFKGMYYCLVKDPFIITLFPFFFASNWFYTYQFNDYNLALFDTRTRSLNGLLYWLSQIFGAGLFGLFLDSGLTRKTRAYVGWSILFTVIMVTWGGDWAVQKHYTRADVNAASWVKMDWKDSGYAGRCFLYIFFGMTDAMWQSFAYWTLGTMSNDPRKLAHLTGFYKGIQSVGAAVVFRLDAFNKPYVSLYGSSWGLCGGSLLVMLPMLIIRVHEHTTVEEELVARLDDQGKLRPVEEVEEEYIVKT